MPSPFPGMDPFLEDEKIWSSFHHHLVSALYQVLLPGLVDRYRARVLRRSYVTEEPLFTSVVRSEHQEEYIEVRRRDDGHWITLIDFPSPSNKTNAVGRAAYLQTRRSALSENAGTVEIDCVLQGELLIDYNREGLPERDYGVTVTRSNQPERFEIYHTTLLKRLPRFKVPLAVDDRDCVLDLQAVFSRAFDQGNFSTVIDYQKDLPFKAGDSHRESVDTWLKQVRLR